MRLSKISVTSLALVFSAKLIFAQPPPPPVPTAPGNAAVPDTDLKTQLNQALESDRLVLSRSMQLEIAGGIVTAKGHTGTLLAKERALELLRKHPGVREVKDQITVRPPALFVDSQLKQNVEKRLRDQRALNGVNIIVTKSVVVLQGEVPSAGQKQLVEQTVKGTVGVLGVENELRHAGQ